MASAGGETGNTVIIGIDFGTTYSGVAFTWSDKIDQMEVITSWESDLHSSPEEEKTPTAISFDAKGKATWGYNIPFDAEQGKWFKLLLIDNKDLPDEVRDSTKIKEARSYLEKHNKTPVQVIAQYLRLLWNHCNQRIVETASKALINYSKFHIVVTVPAIWPEYARGRMREAAKEAGMLEKRIAGNTELSFISEPEAAALATLSDMEGRCDIKPGDNFVVVDCGGGTADLISYEVISIAPMAVKECVKGQGGLCGAVFVDEAFLEVLKQKFGKKVWKKMEGQTRHELLHNEWEHGIKPMFDGRERTWVFKVPFECLDQRSVMRIGAALPRVTLTADDVRTAFDPIVNKIRAMVDEQVAAIRVKKKGKGPKYVIMAGGFGRCRYLFTALKAHLGNDIEVLQSRGSKPWTAICRGAVIHAVSMRGLSSTFSVDVEARVARASYGTMSDNVWRPSKYKLSDKFWHEARQGWYAQNQMNWYIEIGTDMVAREPVRAAFSRLFAPEDASTTKITETIYTSSRIPAPKRHGDDVVALCNIEWDSKLDISSLPTFTNGQGKVFYELKFEIEMVCAGGSLDFAIYHNGKRQGSKNVVAEYHEVGF